MVHTDRMICELIRAYAVGRGLSLTYASRLLAGSGDALARVEGGASMTGRRVEAIRQRAADHWPTDLHWPADIPRPPPRAAAEPGKPGEAA